ncbi:DUF1844 domain-containing protein [bacterium]|nr:DUF1844 domain-containing protein [bacterium]
MATPANPGEMKPAFITIVQLHQIQGMLHLGVIADPATGKPRPVDFGAAKYEIGLLRILRQKTQGNLDEEEERLLDQAIEALETALAEIAGPDAKSTRKRRIVLPGEEE